jgi:hypothetical protein
VKRWSSAALAAAALVAVTACQDTITSPQAGPELRFASNPPPPPADGFAEGVFCPAGDCAAPNAVQTAGALRTFSFASSCEAFTIPVKYMFNLPQLNGWVHFRDDPANGIDVGPNGMVKQHDTTIEGKGKLVVTCGENTTLTIDLSSITGTTGVPPSFIGCPSDLNAAGPPTGVPLVCFQFFFQDATLSDGETTVEGSVEMTGFPVIPCELECVCLDCLLNSKQ